MGLVLLSALAAWAEPQEQEPPRYRASLTLGAAARNSDAAVAGVVPLHIGGVSPTVVHFAGAYFFKSFIGAALDASFETYGIEGDDLNSPRQHVKKQLFGFRVIAEAVGRFSPKSWVGLELHLGYAGGMWPSIRLEGPDVVRSPVVWHGPSIGFAIALEPDAAIGGQLFGRFIPSFGIGTPLNPTSLSSGLQVHFLDIALLSDLRLALLLEGEVIGAGSDKGTQSFSQLQLRFAFGVRIRQQSPPPAGGVVGPKEGTGSIRGRVVTGGIGLSGVTISSATLPETTTGPEGDFRLTDVAAGKHTLKAVLEGAEVTAEGKPAVKSAADGTYAVESVGPGPVKVTVTAKGYKPAEDAAQVPPEGVATLDFALVKIGAGVPATIRGSVRAVSGKAVKATVKISDVNLTIPIKGDGRFVVQVPGGKYTLTIEAAGYVSQVKTVEVADGDQAIFQVDLQPIGR